MKMDGNGRRTLVCGNMVIEEVRENFICICGELEMGAEFKSKPVKVA